MKNRIRAICLLHFKLFQMLHVPSCMLLGILVFSTLFQYQVSWKSAVYYSLTFVLIAMACFSINDYYDFEKDLINKPYRILPMGLIKKENALYLGYILFGCSIISMIFVSENHYEFFMYLFLIIAAWGYGRFIDCLSKVKFIYTAVIVAIPMLFVIHKCQIKINSIIMFVVVVFYISGKELMMDIYDMEGDKQAKQYTIPVSIGEKVTFIISCVLQLIALVLFSLNVNTSGCVIGINGLILGMCYYIWLKNKRILRRYTIYLLWIPLVICLIVAIQ